ncbi:MAG: restriction endonuclease [Caldisphaera sp.]|nr:restriction endonuclease [Caldisphaera sp.]PMP60754.1 MAG: recombinase RecB [Caldisphaera sp.]PMP91413.1 MAG: recombinase RecB [Caldisphaera sp.]
MIQGKSAMRSSESIAKNLLEQMGFRIVDFHKKVLINGIEISDVDIVAEKDGKKYAVEVKAGTADVSSIRQIYVNSKLLNMEPIIISRGLSDEKAEELAKTLNVNIMLVSDQILTSLDEIYASFREALTDFLNDFLKYISKCNSIDEHELKILSDISVSDDIDMAAKNSGLNFDDFIKELSILHNKGVLPKGRYEYISLISKLLIIFCNLSKSNR